MAVREIKTTLAIDGEKKYKASIDEAQRALRVMRSELKAEAAQFDQNASAMQRNETKAKSLRKQIEQQEKIVTSLEGAVKESAKQWGENSKQTDEYRIKLANAQKTLADMRHDLEETTKASDGMGKSLKETIAEMGPELKNAGQAASSVFKSIAAAGTVAFGSIVAAATSAGKGIASTVNDASVKADDLLTLSSQTGVSVEDLQKWQYTSNFIDTDITAIIDFVKQLRQNMQNENADSDANKALRALGVTAREGGQYRNAWDVFWDVIDAAHTNLPGKGEAEMGKILKSLGGEQYAALMPLIQAGRAEWEAKGQAATEKGFILTQEEVEALGAYNDKLQDIKNASEAIRLNLATAFLPLAEPIADDVNKIAEAFNNLVRGDEGAGSEVARAIGQTYTDAIAAVETGWTEINSVISTLSADADPNVSALGKTLGKVADGMEDIWENKDKYVTALEAVLGVMIGSKIAEAIGNLAGLASSLGKIASSLNKIGILTPQTLALLAPGAMIKYGMENPERSTLHSEYYNATTGEQSDIANLQAWITAQNAANAATRDMTIDAETARSLNEAASAARDALLATTGGQDVYERYAGYLSTVEGYDGTVMPDIPEEWQTQAEAQMQGYLNGTDLSVNPNISENWEKNAQATLQSYLNGLDLRVNVTPQMGSISTTGGTLQTAGVLGRFVDGSHASGLERVPFDGYIAELHKDETVLTAAQATRYRMGLAPVESRGMGAREMRQMMNAMGYMLRNVSINVDGTALGNLVAPSVSEAIAREMLQ